MFDVLVCLYVLCVCVHMQACGYSTVHGMASYKGGQVKKPKRS